MTQVRTLAQAEEAIRELRPFRLRDTLRALPVWNGTTGPLPWPDYHESIKDAVYVVISYGTPIAWVRPDGTKVLPDIGYSATTGQHQYIVKDAWNVPGHMYFPARGRTIRPAGGGPRRGGIDS
jgi:hypothetical protein